MSIDVEYAIKKDIKNNPVLREVHPSQGREFVHLAWLMAAIACIVLFSGWQRYKIRNHGYAMQTLERARTAAEALNRRLRVDVETLRAPQRVESIAINELHMSMPSAKDTIVIERTSASAPDHSAVAAAR